MVDHNEEYVALFIDWDNLAISIAADLSGATPDVKRLVQTAQNYGTILIARAYAEWNSTSERLNVYRFGVEPVYAPTFRFEADPITQAARGKSLADPCMVADCVDILHLHPKITTIVIVSGDKDLIPVVRLAQLRGKHVVVIGPDYSAGVLKEITDEFISYRSVIESSNGRQGDLVSADFGKGSRRHAPVRMPQPLAPSVAQRRTTRPTPAPQPASRSRQRDVPFAEQQPEAAHQPAVSEPIEAPKVESAVESRDTSYDLSSVIATMVEIVKQRTGEGKERLRATNLKDALMVKLPGFSERRYGFAKFKDFLIAAEKTGVISLSVAGPVHWVSLPVIKEVPSSDVAQPKGIEVAESPIVAQIPEQGPSEPSDIAALSEDRYSDIVRFVIDLRSRSRWLTYTYVLTNLISFLSKLLPQTEAESAARGTLNRLVQEGILRIDREPQEVEVGGIKHRVRMCHLEEQHPFVTETLAAIQQLRQPTEVEPALAEAIEQEFPVTEPLGEAEARQSEAGEPGATEGLLAFAEEPLPEEGREGEQAKQYESTDAIELTHEIQPEAEHIGAPAVGAEERVEVAPREQPGENHTEPYKGTEQPEESSRSVVGLSVPMSLEEAFDAVDKVVRESAGSGKARVRLTGLKAKLTGELGHFDEQIYGFKRFKDFLQAAERAGRIKLEASGPVVWVTPATQQPQDQQAPTEGSTNAPMAGEGLEATPPESKNGAKNSRSTRRRSQPKTREALIER